MRDERYLRVVKLRGSGYRSGEHAFRISERGLDVYPRLVTPFPPTPYAVTAERLGTGVPDLDAMLGGGLWRGSTTLLAGPAGSGKTILGLHFLFDGVARGEPGLLVSFQESPTALRRTVAGLGWDPAPLAEGGLLAVLASSPVEMNVDDIVGQAEQTIAARSIRRVVIDSLGDLEAAARDRDRFRGYVYSMLRSLAARNITTYLTFETRVEADLGRLTELHISYLCDNALGLRYDVADGGLRRTIAVVKSRGSAHSHRVRRFAITERGIVLDGHVGGEGQRGPAGRE
ncbi:MAG: AAA family ATPase [Chloroflexi bacterium]|nr:AAA family ATPase [Chloroflexota bacterium]